MRRGHRSPEPLTSPPVTAPLLYREVHALSVVEGAAGTGTTIFGYRIRSVTGFRAAIDSKQPYHDPPGASVVNC